MAARDGFQSTQGLSKAVIIVLWMHITFEAIYALSSLAVIAFIGDIQSGRILITDDSPEFAPSEVIQFVVSIGCTILSLTLIFMIGRWIFRSAWNVRHLGAKRLEYSPGWSVGWYFIPFANLVMPFRAMREIWLASHEPVRWRETSVTTLTLWWTLWLVANISANLSLRYNLRAETLEQLNVSQWISVALAPINIALALVFIGIVRRVCDAQDRSAAKESTAEPEELVTAAV